MSELGIAVGQVLLTTNMFGLQLSAPALGDKGGCCVLGKEPLPGLRMERAAAPAPHQLSMVSISLVFILSRGLSLPYVPWGFQGK